MVELIPPPEPHGLLPPLLACLPTAFASRRPPPALLLLLSPILRQRLSLITSTSTTNASDNWLRLLCWDNEKAEKLKEIVEHGTYEPHPASGEIEIGDVGTVKYKRFDQDTLRSQISLQEWGLTAVYLWCADGEGGNGWKLAELLPYEQTAIPDESWSTSITEANSSSRSRIMSEALLNAEAADRKRSIGGDDDYWAMYDLTPARTPAVKDSPAPNPQASTFRSRFGSEDYYAQYGDVQPAMDGHDPSEEVEDAGHSSLNGNALEAILGRQSEPIPPSDPPAYEPADSLHKYDYEDEDEDDEDDDADAVIVNQPQPTSPGSVNGSDAIDRLEATAERQASSEIGIRQHISTSMKSMFRLAKSAGIDREEFERMVHRELETLSILDRDD
jgi:hypothetical protein